MVRVIQCYMMSGKGSGNPKPISGPHHRLALPLSLPVSSSVKWGWEGTDCVAIKVQMPSDQF